VIHAALELADEGGYDGVQMRDVAHRADVALGTVYHYFTSKDHLLAESMVDYIAQLADWVEHYPAVGTSSYERVHDLLRRMTHAVARNQLVSVALIGGLVAEGPQVAACQDEMHRIFAEVMVTAFGNDVSTVDRDRIIRTLEHVWFSCQIAWKNGWMTLETAISELEDSTEVLFSGRH
jgi:AcrR family transcriptional regulator